MSGGNSDVVLVPHGKWEPMESAPKDGTEIIGDYGVCWARIAWSERPVCMAGSTVFHPPGWVTSGGETDDNLPLDVPEGWQHYPMDRLRDQLEDVVNERIRELWAQVEDEDLDISTEMLMTVVCDRYLLAYEEEIDHGHVADAMAGEFEEREAES